MSDRQTGTVKWFNDAKGFGFITPESGPDLFVHFLPLEEQILVVEGGNPEEKMEEKERNRAVRWAVLQMPQPEKEIFLRHYYYAQTVQEIGAVMDMKESTVKTKLRRGRMRHI